MSDVTRILAEIHTGDPTAASRLLPLVYDELRNLALSRMAHEKSGQTLQATALVHEAYLRLVDKDSEPQWSSRGHFFAAAAEAMRRILIENARQRKTLRRGGDLQRCDLPTDQIPQAEKDDELLRLDEALSDLDQIDSLSGRVVRLRYFGGLTMKELAQALDISERSAYHTWTFARTWLKRKMAGPDS